jgi:Flp pilus assembly protein TadG
MCCVPNKFVNDTRGVASLEFVILIPILLMLLIGIYQLTELVRVNARLSRVAVAVADLVAQQSNGITGGQSGSLGNFCAGARLMMTPFPTTGSSTFTLAVASVTNYSGSTGVVNDWEVDTACSGAATRLGSAAAIALANSPVNLVSTSGPAGSTGIAGDSVIVVEANYQYSSLILYLAPSLGTITKFGFARPRANAVVACTASCT